MAKQHPPLLAFNRGEISKLALARVDVERMRLAAETQVNFMPSVLGPMMLRPGTQFIGEIRTDEPCKIIPFIRAVDDTALIEITQDHIRFWVSDALIARATVAARVSHGDFSSATDWTLTATSGCTASISAGALTLHATARGGLASASQAVSVNPAQYGDEHALRIVVDAGPVTFFCGSGAGAHNYIARTLLDKGTHSLAFLPTADFFVNFESSDRRLKTVTTCQVESAGVLDLPGPWAAPALSLIRHEQSVDIVYCAAPGYIQYKIERRGARSWSIVTYRSDDGPFAARVLDDLTLRPDSYEGNGSLYASRPFFENPGHIGAKFRIFTPGQVCRALLGAAGVSTEPIRITGVGAERVFSVVRAGTFVGTLSLERSLDGPDTGYAQVATYTTAATSSFDDSATLANVVAWYRVTFSAYTSGNVTVSFTTLASDGSGTSAAPIGGRAGICRITGIGDSQTATMEVLSPFTNIVASNDWRMSWWTALDDYPSAVSLHEGRLFWFSGERMWGSVPDDYTSYAVEDLDDQPLGDAGAIVRTFGEGPVSYVNWGLSLLRLLAGREMSVDSVRANAFDQPLTPTNCAAKTAVTHGMARVAAAKIDNDGIAIEKSGRRAYLLAFDQRKLDYGAQDLTRLNPDIGKPGLLQVTPARQPDTNIYFPRGDGQCAVLLYDPDDEVEAWWRFQTDGVIENVVMLPEAGSIEDRVYFVVHRIVNNTDKRYLEKLALRDDCVGHTFNAMADSFKIYDGSPTTVLSGFDHLILKFVSVWGDGAYLGTQQVSGAGQIAIPGGHPKSFVVAGLIYEGQFKSAKLAYAAQMGSALNQKKQIDEIGLVLFDTHERSLSVGQSFDTMDQMPMVEAEAALPGDRIWDQYDAPMFKIPGDWDTDARLCLQATAPLPCKVGGVVLGIQTNEKT